ncbi:tannase/feruloyl esterase family alpha/beta hydrolase [Paracraurococcus lichenis]|uniref:Tannase/feruloyl esterase family alpha/beta hydrolase n=1 Tax=Paracraurococcus lichenis TaxID=3064888 RepID=A0ABT9E840_9PROT|nr:tannase/feruloyl esterase family alpha/beta hydrolase [Paracraurococcus sp. LOR1-02]MDO9712289.1 tannase/feruloyl esterase family alpha/beta hydrolase [Paracraurococcus sp. LOR1-02]
MVMQPCRLWAALALCLGTTPALAQSGGSRFCGDLAALALPATTIATAEEVTGGSFTPPGATTPQTGLPAFCRVAGSISPVEGSRIGFEAWLPLQGWNGRYLQVGNGGYAGTIQYGNLAPMLRLGFATASTDDGHDASGPTGSWALGQPQRIIDFGYRAVHQTALRAKEIVQAFYGRPQDYAYWNGCSEGGREGLMEAQRFPADFDGVLAGAPAQYFTHLQAAGVWNQQALQADPASTIPASKAPAIQAAALAQCDAAGDGVQDGIVGDVRACRFDPSVLLCQGEDNDTCLTPKQVTALTRVQRGAHNPRTGQRLFTGYQPGAEAEPSANWNAWFWSGPQANQFVYGDALFQYFVYDDPAWDWRSFDFDTDLFQADSKPIAEQSLGRVMNAVSPDLRAFAGRGGKLIQYHGLNDPAIAPYSINYYESVLAHARRGGAADPVRETQAYYRYYSVPGMGHCSGGPGPNAFGQQGSLPVPADPQHNVLLALQRWVEEGVPPEAIIATKYQGDQAANGVAATRPLCPYPQTAVHDGAGDPKQAGSFHCVDLGLSLATNPGLTPARQPVSPTR